jgi:peptidoglycan/xylan/chitin deacetylase (PgdA/CDA1 family)
MLKHKKLIISILSIVFVTSGLWLGVVRQKYVVPILMYHSVNPEAVKKNRLAVSAESFRKQMRFLKNHHYNVLPLEKLAALIKEKKKLPPKAIAITFDDGYQDNYAFAFPILKEYNLPATIFIIIDEVGRINKEGKRDRLSWDEIGIMRDSGIITFGSHAISPEPLINIKSDNELKRQIFDSKKILERKLAARVNIFCYPGGRFNDKIRKLVIDTGYKVAIVTSPGRRFPNDDIFALKRLRISSSSDNLLVFGIETSGYYTFIKEHRDKD